MGLKVFEKCTMSKSIGAACIKVGISHSGTNRWLGDMDEYVVWQTRGKLGAGSSE